MYSTVKLSGAPVDLIIVLYATMSWVQNEKWCNEKSGFLLIRFPHK